MNQRGYTLTELVIVIAIIGTLASIAIPRFIQANDSAAILKARTDLLSIDGAVAAYAVSRGIDTSAVSLNQLISSGLLPNEPKPPARLAGFSTGKQYYIDENRHRAYLPLTGNNKAILFYSDTELAK